MPRPVHFEIHATDPDRARRFYETLFGWTFKKFDGGAVDYWLITTGPDTQPGINGGMLKRPGPMPTEGESLNAFPCTIGGIASLDATVQEALARGARLMLPKMPIAGVGWLAYIWDPEGNSIGLLQEDKNAK